ncbi:hypothetical protein FQA47_020832 [Oryzias melastigma]|uniref:Uncharacterized protein n=1 Tax=Oryzias melastigma TaxID=30732 RepID=A0A834FB23_ORYME|nr:hypothetical protein FQA47_020832 [Oryzias melastigma]
MHHRKMVDKNSQRKNLDCQANGGVAAVDQIFGNYTWNLQTERWSMVLCHNIIGLNPNFFFRPQNPELHKGSPNCFSQSFQRNSFHKKLSGKEPKPTITGADERCGVNRNATNFC